MFSSVYSLYCLYWIIKYLSDFIILVTFVLVFNQNSRAILNDWCRRQRQTVGAPVWKICWHSERVPKPSHKLNIERNHSYLNGKPKSNINRVVTPCSLSHLMTLRYHALHLRIAPSNDVIGNFWTPPKCLQQTAFHVCYSSLDKPSVYAAWPKS